MSLEEAEQQDITAHVAGRYKADKAGNLWKWTLVFTGLRRMKNPFYQTLGLSKKGRDLYLLYQAQLFMVRGRISCSAEGTALTPAHHTWRQPWKCSCTSAGARAQGHPHTLLRPLCAIKLKASPRTNQPKQHWAQNMSLPVTPAWKDTEKSTIPKHIGGWV